MNAPQDQEIRNNILKTFMSSPCFISMVPVIENVSFHDYLGLKQINRPEPSKSEFKWSTHDFSPVHLDYKLQLSPHLRISVVV
jgi:hypothetical protein